MTDNRTTELLRKLLEERGVEWWEGEDERKTHWVVNGLTWEYFNNENGDAWLGFLGACENDVTPEQAVAATLGSGTCRNQWQWNFGFCCSECFCTVPFVNKFANSPFAYCPNCGAKVVEP